ncbi:LPS export ABC transporter permease LptG [Nitrococcus mobilis]|nr:LPS export ABC transporter permease LptG [Nitrococcus mobilis]
MKTAERYLMRAVAGGFVVAAAVLLPLFSFIDLIEQLDDTGQGNYHSAQAFAYVGLILPRRLIELGPFIALLGTTVALGGLASHRELTALRSVGVSPGGIALAALKAGVLLILLLAAIDQLVASPLQQHAFGMRATALSGDSNAESGSGAALWARRGDRLLRVGALRLGRIPADIEIFHFNAEGHLVRYIHADYAEIHHRAPWRLNTVLVKAFMAGTPVTTRHASMVWQTFLTPAQIGLLEKPAESLSPVQLYGYVQYLRSTGQSSAVYAVMLWQKLGLPLTAAAMILLAVPFSIGAPRGASIGSRIALGAIAGLGVYLADQIIVNMGLLLDLSPPLIALGPGAVLLAVALAALGKSAARR